MMDIDPKGAMHTPGAQLEQLCEAGRREVLLVAPFIKVGALARLLERVRGDVELRCVTRWRPEEIVAGVSDLEIWPLLRDRPRSSLWLHPDLHAKFYRADGECLIGSANLTDTALGWASHPNLELLLAVAADHPVAREFEAILARECFPVDEDLFQQMSQAAALLQQHGVEPPRRMHEERDPTYEIPETESPVPASHWLPTLRQPADLYLAYTQRDNDLTTAARAAAVMDLHSLVVPPHLPQPAFEAYIGILLLQKPLVRQIDTLLVTAQRFGAVRDVLARLPCATNPDFNPTRAWQTLMRWLLYFLPRRYERVPSRHSEVLRRAGEGKR